LILNIEQAWNRDPGWFDSLEQSIQADLIAKWNIDHQVEKPKTALQFIEEQKREQQLKSKLKQQQQPNQQLLGGDD